MKALILSLAAALVAMPAGAQEAIPLPDFGDSAGAIISPQQERRLGEQTMREIRRQAPLIDDAEVEDYLRSLGNRVAKPTSYSDRINFFMIGNPEIQAFAIPGGYIGVHSGLILNSRTESELASVLAHEIVHLTQRHTVRGIEAQGRSAIPSLIAMLGAIALAAASAEAGQAAIAGVTAAQQQYAINFTRANEKEADNIGIQLLYDAGFNPRAMPAFFERLQIANRYNDPAHIPEYLRTHPITTTRITESRERAERFPVVPDESSTEYYLISAKLRVLTASTPIEALQYYEAILRNEDYEDRDVALYGYALALTQAADYKAARATLDDLIAHDPARTAYHVAAADVEMQSGDIDAAVEKYRRAYGMNPDYRAAFYGYARALTHAGRPEEARTVLREHGVSDDDDPNYFRLLSEAEARAGNAGDARIDMAEYYFRIGEYPLAMRELQLARELTDLTNYQTQRIRARLAELTALMAAYREAAERR